MTCWPARASSARAPSLIAINHFCGVSSKLMFSALQSHSSDFRLVERGGEEYSTYPCSQDGPRLQSVGMRG